MKLLQVLLIVLVVYVSFRLVFKYFGKSIMAWLGKKAMERMARSFEKRSGMNMSDFNHPREKTTANHKKVNKPAEKKVVGEYVDFEEID